MIHRIFSSLPTFKELVFRPGLNVLVSKKEADATTKQTRNRAGKTSLVEIIHFICGATVEKDSIFCSKSLQEESFGITIDLGNKTITAERSCKVKSRQSVQIQDELGEKRRLPHRDWLKWLGESMFGLCDLPDQEGRTPTFRSLFPYFARRQYSEAFVTPEKQASQQQMSDYQIALLYLLGLDWRIASDWQSVRDREKTLAELKKAVKKGGFGEFIGKASDLRTQFTVAEARLQEMQSHLAEFHVLPQYSELETEANELTRSINILSNENVIDSGAVRDLEIALQAETPPSFDEVRRVYEEAGVYLPEQVIKRYEDVQLFHESIIRNRRDYLSGELEAAQNRITQRDIKKKRLVDRRAEIMKILDNHGALEHFNQLQAEIGRKKSDVEILRQRLLAAEQLESTRHELDFERNHLALRLRRDFVEQENRLKDAILAFEDISRHLYESAGSMAIDQTPNGPAFQFHMQGSRSKGIKNMQIFCFDMMLMRLLHQRGWGPGFVIHDSHLYDGVDGRQVISALKTGAEVAEKLGFQYIVTMNEDDAFKEKIEGFDLEKYVLPIVLTDATEDGGLFGIRFD